MYTPPAFRTNQGASLALADGRGFGTVCAWNGSKPVASSLPFVVDSASDGTPRLAFHVARQNELVGLADGRSSWLMTITGDDAYVSPDWYVSPDQVPTWLYTATHCSGPVRAMSADELSRHLDMLSDKFEERLLPKPIWKSAKMTAARLETMKRAIVGLVMSVEHIEGSRKLNQHKSDVDFAALAAHLAQRPDAASQNIARDMRAEKPHLFAAQSNAEVTIIQEGTV